MDSLIFDIESALEADMWTLALSGALTLPDICAALASPDGRTNGERYRAWCDTNFITKYPRLTSDDCWQLRCSVVHQSRSTTRAFDRILFTIGGFMHNNVIDGALNLDIGTFVRDLLQVSRRWWHLNNEREPVATNKLHMLRLYPQGLSPYIVGAPVIA